MWSQEEIKFLFDNPNMSLKDLAAHLPGRTEGSIRAKRSRLKIHSHSSTSRPWTIKEKELLQEKYSDCTKEELLELLPDRTWDSVRSQVAWLKKKGIKI